MTRLRASPALSKEKASLLETLSKRLEPAMGVRPFWSSTSRVRKSGKRQTPAQIAAGFFLLYAVLATIAIGATIRGGDLTGGHARLLGLIVWAGLYFTAAIALARAATLDALDIVERDILPHASRAFVRAVSRDLQDRAPGAFDNGLPWAIAAAASALAYWATVQDVGVDLRDQPFPFDLLLWISTCFYLTLTATQAVIAAPFYRSFARGLASEKSGLSILAAAESPLVLGLSKLATRILAFWSLIFLTVAAILILVPLPWGIGMGGRSMVVFLLLPIAGFFSLGFGAIVYISSEAMIRTALRRFTLDHARPLQRKANALIRRDKGPVAGAMTEIEQLRALSEAIIASGRYGSKSLTGLSIALPLVLPIISIIRALAGG